MADCIDRDRALQFRLPVKLRPTEVTAAQVVVDAIAEYIKSIPAADVRPVVRGRWTWDENGMDWGIGAWRCSACGMRPPMWWNTERTSPMNKNGHCFCPNCGAEMEAVDG